QKFVETEIDGSHRRPGRRWRVCGLAELHIARRPAHGVCAALKPNGRSARYCSRSRVYRGRELDMRQSARAGGGGARSRRFRVRDALNQGKDRPGRQLGVAIMVAAGPFVVGASLVLADGVGDPTAVKHDDGRYYDKEGNPTFKVQSDGTVDWGTYSGF